MAHPGDQHKSNGYPTTNPYEEQKQRISEYTAQEIARLQTLLDKRLGPEFISTRPGAGGQKVAYLQASKVINLANEVLGFNGWSSSVQQIDVDFVEENPNTGKVSLGLSAIVRVTLKDGTYHEDVGYGGIENCKGKAAAFEKCKKEAITDALKRALRNFGNVLGNCIYDHAFITTIVKIKPGPGSKFDINDLHRHPDYAPKQREAIDAKPILPAHATKPPNSNSNMRAELDDSFDMGEFDDADFDEGEFGHPDEVLLPVEAAKSNMITPSKPLHGQPLMQTRSSTPRGNLPPQQPNQKTPARYQNTEQAPSSMVVQPQILAAQQPAQVPLPGQSGTAAQGTVSRPSGFYSAKAAQNIDQNNVSNLPINASQFNPHAESPSIRKTAGVDHKRSVPVKREALKGDVTNAPKDILDPRGDSNRRIGMPGQTGYNGTRGGPSASSYRPPTRHGSPALLNGAPVDGSATVGGEKPLMAVKRPPLADVSNGQHNTTAMTVDGADAKRQKLAGPTSLGQGTMTHGVGNT